MPLEPGGATTGHGRILDRAARQSDSVPAGRAGDRYGARGGVPDRVSRAAYRAYRRRQAQALLDLVPLEAIRPLYARARAWSREGGRHDTRDPMASLLGFCEEILPLPPFSRWVEDVGRHPSGHLEDLARAPEESGSEAGALPLEVRSFVVGSTRWFSTLGVFYRDGAWRGHLTFHRGPGSRPFRTAAIFRERDAEAIRLRFIDFDDSALRAFLRSLLP